MMTNTAANILIVDDNEDILLAADMLLSTHYSHVRTESDPQQLPILLVRHHFDVVLLDMNFTLDANSGKEGFYWLEKILALVPDAVVILITAYGDMATAIDAIKAGAADFVLKPWQNEKLLATIASAIKLNQSKSEVKQLKRKSKRLNQVFNQSTQKLIGQSPAMLEIYTMIERAAVTNANILLLGESGTGKELVAKAIHQQSLRDSQAFISVDLGAISESLFESELFGHKKGAFTDAKEDRIGRFELADQGTLFFDEIGNLPFASQSKLLTAIQSKQITPLGKNTAINIDIRLICATNEDIYQRVHEQSFRQDLLYRINTIEIHLPALRDRQNDIPLLIAHFLNHYSQKYKRDNLSISDETMQQLCLYHWPGNIRELQHSVERAVILSDSNELQLLPRQSQKNTVTDKHSQDQDELNLEIIEKRTIGKALDKFKGNISQAASALGLARASLYRKIDKYDL